MNESELYRTEFRARTKRDDERPLNFAMALRTLAFRTFPKMAPAQRDLLSRDHFIDGLTEDDLRIRVRHAKLKSLDDAVKAALELESINRSEAKRRTKQRAVKSSSAIPGVRFHEQLVTTMKEMTAALQEVSGEKPRDYRATEATRAGEGGEAANFLGVHFTHTSRIYSPDKFNLHVHGRPFSRARMAHDHDLIVRNVLLC